VTLFVLKNTTEVWKGDRHEVAGRWYTGRTRTPESMPLEIWDGPQTHRIMSEETKRKISAKRVPKLKLNPESRAKYRKSK